MNLRHTKRMHYLIGIPYINLVNSIVSVFFGTLCTRVTVVTPSWRTRCTTVGGQVVACRSDSRQQGQTGANPFSVQKRSRSSSPAR
jgi:hypothetical protein